MVRWRGCAAFYNRDRRSINYTISVSEALVGHFDTLAPLMAHEMVHLKQDICRTDTRNTQHNAEFFSLSAVICREMGWDPKFFVL